MATSGVDSREAERLLDDEVSNRGLIWLTNSALRHNLHVVAVF